MTPGEIHGLHSRIVDDLRAHLAAAREDVASLRRILSTWAEWGGHCPTCEFVRQKAANPVLDTSLFVDYCDCGWYLANKAVEVLK